MDLLILRMGLNTAGHKSRSLSLLIATGNFASRSGYLNWTSKEDVPSLYSINTSSHNIPLLVELNIIF
jgi:hypothetical protein